MRVAFIVDGYNLYHSIRDAEKVVADRPMRWLDLCSLCSSYLHHFGRHATLQGVYYFSAEPRHLAATKPGIEGRHHAYMQALAGTGVVVSLGNFKAREKHIPLKYCRFKLWPMRRPVCLPIPRCSFIFTRSEEKETDVAIASKMFELLHLGVADAVVLISGDTDLIPAIRTAGQLFPAAQTAVMFPYNRHNAELKRAVRRSFKISKDKYAKHQLPDPVLLSNGYEVRKPQRW
jgi:uncharacterized LabA/DUF88 family protein